MHAGTVTNVSRLVLANSNSYRKNSDLIKVEMAEKAKINTDRPVTVG